MKSTLLTKAALCICPPALVATTAATVPPVKRAVHHLTQAYEPHRPAAPKGAPCIPAQHKTFASELPAGSVLDDMPPDVIANPAITRPPDSPPPYLPPFRPTPPNVLPPNNGPGGVPEPAAWMTMVFGFGVIGCAVRRRRRQQLAARRTAMIGGPSGSGSIAGAGARSLAGAGGVFGIASLLSASTAPVQASTRLGQLGSKALHSSMLAKAAMCVCPPVAMVLGTAAVPPLRHAVYSATAPKPTKPAAQKAVLNEALPCVPVDVPTAAEAVRQSGDNLAVFKPAMGFPG